MTRYTLPLVAALLCPSLWAQSVTVSQAWVRSSVAGQKATGGFLTLQAETPAVLVQVSTPAAGRAEIHEMRMEGDVMTMRALPQGLSLPAGQAVSLRPGGIHLMLLDLKKPIAAGRHVTLTLTFQTPQGQRWQQTIDAPAHPQAPTTTKPH